MKIETLVLMTLAGGLYAQQITDTRIATRTGGGGDGKCTIEVEVDGLAEVEIFGNRAQIRTLSGSPSTFRRFECNQDMPAMPNDFRFKGIDGRGKQEMMRSAGGRSPAVIRIEDSQGGREGYTFDVMWRGGSGVWDNTNNNGNTGSIFGDGRNNDTFGNNPNSGTFGDGRNNGGFGNNRNRGRDNDNYGNNNTGWNRKMNFRGRGQGFFRNDRGSNATLKNCRVEINQNGMVETTFQTDGALAVSLRGRVQRVDNDRIYADMSGNDVTGVMEIITDGRNRVRSVQMGGNGNNGRFELNWRE